MSIFQEEKNVTRNQDTENQPDETANRAGSVQILKVLLSDRNWNAFSNHRKIYNFKTFPP